MRIPLQLAVIFAICVAGEVLHRVVGVPMPGNIIGMVRSTFRASLVFS